MGRLGWFLLGGISGLLIAAVVNADVYGAIALAVIFGIVGALLGPQTDAPDQG